MPFRIERNDITKVKADAIVNTANPSPKIGSGTDTLVYEAAGKTELLEARKKIGAIERGQSAYTPSFKLKNHGVKYIIHTVGTFWQDDKNNEKQILHNCYKNSLELAKELKCESIAIPLLATGNYGFPKDLALQIAIDEISSFIFKNDMEVILVVFDKTAFCFSEKLFGGIQSFIDDNYVAESNLRNNTVYNYLHINPVLSSIVSGSINANEIKSEKKFNKEDNEELKKFILKEKSKINFQDYLLNLIADKNLDNADIYKKAGVDRKFFSKIISTKNYIPKKHTVMALGLALELPIEEFEKFLASAGYALMASDLFDVIIKFCVTHQIYNLVTIDSYLFSNDMDCFSIK